MKRVLSLIMLAIMLTGCNSSLSVQQATPIDLVLQQRYADLGHVAGFKNGKPSIYTTLWTLKTLNELEIKISHKSEIIDWMNSVELVQSVHSTNTANSEWLEGLPPEYALIFQLEIFNELGTNVPTKYLENIDNHFRERQQSDGSFVIEEEINDPHISTLWAIRIYDLLKLEIPYKNKVVQYINNRYFNLESDISIINHVYYLTMLKQTIPDDLLLRFKEVVKGLSTDIYNSKDSFRTTHMWYQIKIIATTIPVDIKIEIGKDKLLYSFNQYFNGEGSSPEVLYKYCVIYDDKINKDEKEELKDIFENTYFNNGWNTHGGLLEDGYEEGRAIAIATSQAKEWGENRDKQIRKKTV
ncbi:hypothetical protein FHS16_003752 [Paenibacillus endophyticus]|uniref:Lipoprotein n=1 Tax=Paenibacillus endophyticus TaxID=1294268 RepID=A0A7W5C9M5_9BACL|nr:hypothetical protein [Paenibacillus endophyticus]MBB3153677.1 hypothetical protein [Paenibacillus endophyticus]